MIEILRSLRSLSMTERIWFTFHFQLSTFNFSLFTLNLHPAACLLFYLPKIRFIGRRQAPVSGHTTIPRRFNNKVVIGA